MSSYTCNNHRYMISNNLFTYRSGPCDRNSPISTASSIAVAGNIIPIRATHAALVWNSVKTGKSETKEFTIRNTSNNKVKIQIDICDESKSFKVLHIYIHTCCII